MATGASVGYEWQQAPRKHSPWAWLCQHCHMQHGEHAWNRPKNAACYICKAPRPSVPFYHHDAVQKEKADAQGKGKDNAKGKGKAGGKSDGKGKDGGKAKGKAADKGKGKGKGNGPTLGSIHGNAPAETPLQQAQCKLLSVETVMLDAGVKTEDFHTKALWRAASASVEALKPVAVPTTRVADTAQVASWKQELALSIQWRTGESADNAAIHARCTELEAWIQGAAATAAAATTPLGSAALKKAEQERDAARRAAEQTTAKRTKLQAQLDEANAEQQDRDAKWAVAEAAVVDCKRQVASGPKGAVVSEDQLACIATQVASLDTTMRGARSALVREDVTANLAPAAKISIDALFDAVQFLVAALTPEMRRPITTNEAPIGSAGAGVPTLAAGSNPLTSSGGAAAIAGADQPMPDGGAAAAVPGLAGGLQAATQDVDNRPFP